MEIGRVIYSEKMAEENGKQWALPSGPRNRLQSNEYRDTKGSQKHSHDRGHRKDDRYHGRDDRYRNRRNQYRDRDNYRKERDWNHGDQGRGAKGRHVPKHLEHVISINKRDRSLFTLWDVRPENFENISAEKAKLLGVFPISGSNRKQLDSQAIEQIIKNENNKDLLNISSQIDPKDAVNAKRIFVQQVEDTEVISSIVEHVTVFLSSLKVFEDVSTFIVDKRLRGTTLILEFSKYQLATAALALNDYIVHDANGFQLKLQRPYEYIVPAHNHLADPLDLKYPFLKDSESKLTITNIPVDISQAELQSKLAQQLGQDTCDVNILFDKQDASKGIAFVHFPTESSAYKALTSFNSVSLGNQQLKCVKSCSGFTHEATVNYRNLVSTADGKHTIAKASTTVLQLLNLVDYLTLLKSQDLTTINKALESVQNDVTKKIATQCESFEVKVPKLEQMGDQLHNIGKLNGVGSVFVKFNSLKDSEHFYRKLNGTKYYDRLILVTFFSESDFELGVF